MGVGEEERQKEARGPPELGQVLLDPGPVVEIAARRRVAAAGPVEGREGPVAEPVVGEGEEEEVLGVDLLDVVDHPELRHVVAVEARQHPLVHVCHVAVPVGDDPRREALVVEQGGKPPQGGAGELVAVKHAPHAVPIGVRRRHDGHHAGHGRVRVGPGVRERHAALGDEPVEARRRERRVAVD